jgi:hypothetical protein
VFVGTTNSVGVFGLLTAAPTQASPESAFAEAYARPTGCEGLQLPASSIWIMRNGAPAYSITLPTIPIEWQVAGAADLLGTGQADLI